MNRWVIMGALAIFIGFIYLTKAILLPFLAGLAIAYFLDPVADKLEAYKVPRGIAASIVLIAFTLLFIGIVFAFWPVIKAQTLSFAAMLPKTMDGLKPLIIDLQAVIKDNFGLTIDQDAGALINGAADYIASSSKAFLSSAVKNGLALFNILTLILISPVVAFYLLRDWDHLIAKANSLLPTQAAVAVRSIATEIDQVLAGFVRGQLIVCMIMGVLYAIGWSIAGLKFSIVLGLLAGILAFIPVVGAIFAVMVAMLVGVGQWGLQGSELGAVFLVFVIVQILEASFFTPKMVGDKVRLHPVWVLFAIFAGSEVLGFVGILIAVPMAAAIAVAVRWFIQSYIDHYQLAPDVITGVGNATTNVEETQSKGDDQHG